MSVTLFGGPMFGGKSTELIRMIDRAQRGNKRVLSIKSSVDDRNGRDDLIHSHNDQTAPALVITRLAEVPPEDAARADVIAIDEGQFFADLDAHCDAWAAAGKRVYVAALLSDADQNPWPAVVPVAAKATHIEMCLAVCAMCGSDEAPFTVRRPGFRADSIVAVGGADEYRSVCRACLPAAKSEAAAI